MYHHFLLWQKPFNHILAVVVITAPLGYELIWVVWLAQRYWYCTPPCGHEPTSGTSCWCNWINVSEVDENMPPSQCV